MRFAPARLASEGEWRNDGALCGDRAVGALAAMMPPVGAVAADTFEVIIDQAQILRLPHCVGTIMVSNPLIADVTVQSGGLMVVTGKGYGRTSVVALDDHGGVLLQKVIQVQGRTMWS